MKTFAIIDDKDSSRRSLAREITNALERLYPDWKVIDRKPFMNIKDYPAWIMENEISVLILDEQLNGEAVEGGRNVEYNGSDLVKELRTRFKEFPIYSITSYPVSENLADSLKYFNLILGSREFSEDIDKYINLLVRSGVNFYKEYQIELERLGDLAEKIANGTANPKDLAEAKGLQTRLQIPNTIIEISDREKHLSDLEKSLEEVKKVSSQIAELLKSKG